MPDMARARAGLLFPEAAPKTFLQPRAFRGRHTHLFPPCGLGPGFCGRSVRPRGDSRRSIRAGAPGGRPVRACRRRRAGVSASSSFGRHDVGPAARKEQQCQEPCSDRAACDTGSRFHGNSSRTTTWQVFLDERPVPAAVSSALASLAASWQMPRFLQDFSALCVRLKAAPLTKGAPHVHKECPFRPGGCPAGGTLRHRVVCGAPSAGRTVEGTAAADGRKVILTDTGHLWGIGGNGAWVWKSFLRGLNPIFMDPYDGTILGNRFDPKWEPLRRSMGYALAYARRMNLAAMTPQSHLASTGYCLANAGVEYLVYQPKSGENFSIELKAGTYRYEWFNPMKGAAADTGRLEATDDRQQFKSPFEGDTVLYLKAQ